MPFSLPLESANKNHKRCWVNKHMSEHVHVKIILSVGLAGAGKTTATEYMTAKASRKSQAKHLPYATEHGASIYRNHEANERSFITPPTSQGHAQFIEQYTLPHFRRLSILTKSHRHLDGSSSLEEYRALMAAFPGSVTTVAIVAPKHLRYGLKKRPDHPLTRAGDCTGHRRGRARKQGRTNRIGLSTISSTMAHEMHLRQARCTL